MYCFYLKSALAGSSGHSCCLLSFSKDTFLLSLLKPCGLCFERLYKSFGVLLKLSSWLDKLWNVECTADTRCLESQKLTQSEDVVGHPVDEDGL